MVQNRLTNGPKEHLLVQRSGEKDTYVLFVDFGSATHDELIQRMWIGMWTCYHDDESHQQVRWIPWKGNNFWCGLWYARDLWNGLVKPADVLTLPFRQVPITYDLIAVTGIPTYTFHGNVGDYEVERSQKDYEDDDILGGWAKPGDPVCEDDGKKILKNYSMLKNKKNKWASYEWNEYQYEEGEQE